MNTYTFTYVPGYGCYLHDTENKERTENEKEIEQTEKFSFHVAHPVQIDRQEIRSCLSRKRLLALIHADRKHYILLHRSIIQKANILNIFGELEEVIDFESDFYP